MAPPPFRAEHIGSLLRPDPLKAAARARADDPAAYAAALDRAVEEAVRMQEGVGLEVVTDGEFGRSSWFGFFFERLEGFRLEPSRFAFTDDSGDRYGWPTCFAQAPMRRPAPIAVDELVRVQRLTDRTIKANLPSPAALHFFRGDDCRDPAVYPDLDAWWDDLIAIYRAEIADLAAAGCTYLQIDEVPLAMLCDPAVRAAVASWGLDPVALVDTYVDVLNRAVAERPATMTVGVHLCRGNFRSRWMATGGYEPVAAQVFGNLAVDALFLEYDSERAGDFAPLRHVRDDLHVVAGLVSTKTAELEAPDALRRRLDAAARYVPQERLALSPQCGFASVAGGNLIGPDDQRRKLALVVDVAATHWG